MARKPTLRAQINSLIDGLEPGLAKAFRESVAGIKSNADLRRIIEALERGDIDGAIRAINLDRAAYAPLENALANAYQSGGALTASAMPRIIDRAGAQVVVRFDVRNPRAEQWLRNYSSNQITGLILPDQRQAIRTTIEAGYARGDGPRSIARSLIGTWDRSTQSRTGGVIGLTNAQAQALARAREELTSGDTALLRNFLTRARRDAQYDTAILNAIKNGEPLSASTISRALVGYEERLLELRSNMLARTETMQAVHAAEREAFVQGIEKAGYSADRVVKTWRSAGDGRVRDTHAGLNGKSVTGTDTPFQSSYGALMRYPGDSELGAGPAEVINCFPPWTMVSVFGLKGAVRREYRGELVEVSAGGVVNLAVTPNHPILTQRGWVAAGDVVEGDQLVYSGLADALAPGGSEGNVGDAHSTAEHLYNAAASLGEVGRASCGVVNLHGEVPSQDVDVVTVPRSLWYAFDASRCEHLNHFGFAESDIEHGVLLCQRALELGARVSSHPSNGAVGRRRSVLSRLWGSLHGASSVAFRYIGSLNAEIFQASIDCGPANAQHFRNGKNRVSVIEEPGYIRRVSFSMSEMARRRGSSFNLANLATAQGPQTEIFQAGQDSLRRDAEPGSSDARGDAFLSKAFDAFQVWRSRIAVALNRISTAASDDPSGFDRHVGCRLGYAHGIGGLRNSHSGSVCSDQPLDKVFSTVTVTKSMRRHYVGPVYNFEAPNALILAENVISHNCRCSIEYNIDFSEGVT